MKTVSDSPTSGALFTNRLFGLFSCLKRVAYRPGPAVPDFMAAPNTPCRGAAMPTINQLVRKGRTPKSKKSTAPALLFSFNSHSNRLRKVEG